MLEVCIIILDQWFLCSDYDSTRVLTISCINWRSYWANSFAVSLMCLMDFLISIGHLFLNGVWVGVNLKTNTKSTCVERCWITS